MLNMAFENLWKKSINFNINELVGKYDVKILSSQSQLLLLLNVFGDEKRIQDNKGFNYMLKIKWGSFIVKQFSGCVALIYNDNKIIDYLRKVEEDLYLGKFYYKYKFLCYFELKKQNEDSYAHN